MNIRKTIITTAVALTTVALIAPVLASADQISDLQNQINVLMAQLNSLKSSSSTSGVPAACSGVSFLRDLKVGSKGADVKCLQALLNTSASTQIASTGVGSPGKETTNFGPLTLVAVKKYQLSVFGYGASKVGPLTRAKLNTWLGLTTGGATGGTTTGGTTTGGVTIVPTGAGLTVALASDTPVAGAVAKSAALVPLLKLNFINGDNAQVKVTTLKLHRIGLSADASLSNVYLFNGANRLTDAAGVSTGLITFNDANGVVTVDAKSSKSITVYADLSATAGETLGISMSSASDLTSNASSTNGIFPINGNLMSVAAATLAGVDFNSSTTPTAANINPINDVVVWENLTSVTTRAVTLGWLRLKEIGTVATTDLRNFRLYIDGVQVGAAVANLDSNYYLTFDLTSSPVTLQTGTRDIKVLGDVIGGSNKKFSFSMRVAADGRFTDSQYGGNVLATANGSTFSARTSGDQTINSGTITVAKSSDSPSGNITKLASNQVLARYTLTAAGEKVKVDTLTAKFSSSNSCTSLRNGAIYANGVQVGSTASLKTSNVAYSLGSSLIVDPLTPVKMEIRADVYCDDGTNTLASGDTLTAKLVTGSSNGTGQVSLVTSNVPTSDLSGNQLTVKVGSLTLSKYTAYVDQTTVPPLTKYKLAHFTLTNDAVEPVNLSTIKVDTTLFASGTSNDVLKNLYVQYGASNTTTVTPSISSATTTYSINYQLAAGQTIDAMVFADVLSTASGKGTGASVEFKGTTVNSATAVNTNSDAVLAGQTINFTTGSINAVVDGTTPLNQSVAGNQSVTAGKFKFVTSNDSYTIQEARFTVQGNNGAVINNATLWDGSANLGTVPYDSANNRFYFTGLNVSVPANTTKVLALSLNLVTPFTDGTTITTGKNVAVTLSYIKTLNGSGVMHDAGSGTLSSSDSSVTIAGTTTGTSAGNYLYVYKTLPTFAVGTVDIVSGGTNLSAGSTTNLYSFTVSAPSQGAASLRQLQFKLSTNDINTSTVAQLSTFKFFRGSTDLTQAGSVAIRTSSGTDITGSSSVTAGPVVVIFYPEETIPAGSSYTYTLKATPTGFSTSTSGADSVSTSLALPTDTTPAGVAAGADTARYYLQGSGNTNVQKLATTANGGTNSSADVIWSDFSAKVHDATDSSTGSSDWFNGYLINNLPLDSVGISAR